MKRDLSPPFFTRPCLLTLNIWSFDYYLNFDYELDYVDNLFWVVCCILLQQIGVDGLFCSVCDCCSVWSLFCQISGVRSAGRSGRVTTGLQDQVSERGGAGPTQGDRERVKCAALDNILVRTLHLSAVFLQIKWIVRSAVACSGVHQCSVCVFYLSFCLAHPILTSASGSFQAGEAIKVKASQ